MSPRNGICGGSGSIRDSHATAAYSIETDMTTDGKAIFITGASTGIGRASALALADAGHTVYAGVRGESAGAALVDGAPASLRSRLRTIRIDVTDAAGIADAASRLEAEVGDAGLWGLFNNAGIAVSGPIECTPMDRLREQFEVNVFGQVAVTQACLPMLRRARGRILLTGSIAGFGTLPALGPYSMSKHAVEALAVERAVGSPGQDSSVGRAADREGEARCPSRPGSQRLSGAAAHGMRRGPRPVGRGLIRASGSVW